MSLAFNNVLNLNKKNYNGVTIEELSLSGKINIRGKSSDKEFMKNIGSALNLVLPIEPNVRIFNNNISIMWLGPNEWLVITPENEKDGIISLLKSNLNPQKTAITDVSFNRTILRLEGEKVFTLLSKFLVANLEKILKTNFSVAQSIFIKIPVLFVRNNTDEEPTSLDLHLNRSHTKYVYELLVDGSKNLNI
tara:strand:+ start:4753 stop:5328 length:576 start_codon:yes stop_codon:yes gene_type:complete